MIKKYDYVSTTIEDVTSIAVEETQAYDSFPYDDTKSYSRCITVHTQQGETFTLWLHADTEKKLELKKPTYDAEWIHPKVYKGKSMHEEELENHS